MSKMGLIDLGDIACSDHGKFEDFTRESNRIEGISRPPYIAEVKALKDLVRRKRVEIEHVQKFVAVCQPGAVLRDVVSIPGVRVGTHVAPPSGPKIATDLRLLLNSIAENVRTPWSVHVAYENLHPFTDGNGRSGRALWLWHMTLVGEQHSALQLGFLHKFYYQTLGVDTSRLRGF